MKKLIYIIVVFCTLTIWSGCKKGFLDSYPKNSLSAGTFYKTEADFTNAVNGIYDAMQADRELSFFPMTDIATPFAGFGENRFGQYDNGLFGINSGWIMGQTIWAAWYKVVFRANVVLDRIDGEGITMTAKAHDRLKGEALFLRSIAYFYLTYLYGGVPLILKEQKYEELLVPRNGKSEVVARLIADLKTAEQLLPSVTEYRNTKPLLGRASKGAAKSLLGKIYVYEKKWPEAEAKLNEVINIDKDYDLEPKFLDLFWPSTENGKESIFEIQYLGGVKEGNSYVRFAAPNTLSQISTAGFGYVTPTETYTDLFETVNGYPVNSTFVSRVATGSAYRYTFTRQCTDPAFNPAQPYANRDPRLAWTVWYENTPYIAEFQSRAGQTGVKYLQEYANENGHNTVKYIIGKLDLTAGDSPGNMILIRYADVLLLYAETLIELNRTADAAVYINKVRQRPSVMMPTLQTLQTVRGENIITDQTKMRKFLHEERYRELAFEWGHMYMDQVRWDVFADEMVKYWTANKFGGINPALGTFDKRHYLWPIPAEERIRNPQLSQNDGYN
uniref:RagB/SusD family nutrient uptake outer membrane protein n=1 Tax=Pedobacter schmidteae TaxID=2201271 RepID=UPI000EAFD7A1|nr:RagB/SusD family nutrient uptake outer membrane protein [Pedobacter schmidteae]